MAPPGIQPHAARAVRGMVYTATLAPHSGMSRSASKGMMSMKEKSIIIVGAGMWATSAGALPMNALSGKRVAEGLCKADGRAFTSSAA